MKTNHFFGKIVTWPKKLIHFISAYQMIWKIMTAWKIGFIFTWWFWRYANEKWNFNCNGIMWLPVEKFGSGISEKMFLLFYLSSWEIMIFLPCFVCHIVCKCLIHRVSCLENKKIDTNSKSQLGLCLAKFSFVLGLKKGIYLSHMYMTCWMVIWF